VNLKNLSMLVDKLKLAGSRTIFLTMIILVMMMGCDDNDTVAPVNNPPEIPSVPYPPDGTLEQGLYVELQWQCMDPENDALNYDLYFGTTAAPELVDSNLVDYIYPLYRLLGSRLDFNTTYYWQVAATDAAGNVVEGDVWSFTTSNLYLVSAVIENTDNKNTYDTRNANKLYVSDITADSCLIYVADDNYGLRAITLKDTMIVRNRVDSLTVKTGVEIGAYGLTEFVYDVDVAGDLAFVTSRSGHSDYSDLTIIDVSDPSDSLLFLTEIGSHRSSGLAFYAVSVSGTDAFIASGDGLLAIDVSDPASPVSVSTFDTPGTAHDVFVNGNYAYVADTDSGLQVIDVSDPANPALVGNYMHDPADSAWGVFVSGNTAYVAYGNAGLVLVDITTPSSPSLIGGYDTPGFAMDVYADANYAYVADYWNGGLQVIDISAPTAPTLAAQYNSLGGASGSFANDNYIFLADRWNGLLVFEFQP